MPTKKLEKKLQGNRWFENVIKKLQSEPRYMRIDLEIVIIQAISRYLTGAIDSIMFMNIINNITNAADNNKITEIHQLTKPLLALSEYSSNLEENREEFIEILNATVSKIENDIK